MELKGDNSSLNLQNQTIPIMVKINYDLKDKSSLRRGECPVTFWIDNSSKELPVSSTANHTLHWSSTFNKIPQPGLSEDETTELSQNSKEESLDKCD